MPHSDLIHLVQGKIKKSAVKHKVGCHCSRGPGDNRSKEASAAETEGGKRIDRTALGLSCRVGCGVHFSGRTQPGTEHITEILYYHTDHSSACQVMTLSLGHSGYGQMQGHACTQQHWLQCYYIIIYLAA